MIRTATPRRFLPRTVFVAVAAALLAACSAGPGASDRASSGPEPVSRARLSHDLPDDPMRMVLPATGAESRWTQGLDVFVRQVSRATSVSCAQDQGIGLPEEAPVSFIRFFDVPDLDFIARHGLSESAQVPAIETGPAATRSGSSAVVRRCVAEGAAAADALFAPYAGLQRGWFRELASVGRAPATHRALRTLPGCLARHGVDARDERGVMAVADARMQTAAPADLRRSGREIGRAYATCLRPVEAVREPARLRLRDRFIAEHADEVREVRKTLVPALRRAEKEHGVRLVFPAP
ncbi:hypothetical protein [Streptomyces spongiae]|uniref:Uncharacterized protein n=1 Tax=Streptomyces spongiae TaxID=565072 RepID=A0A5N8XYE7_9ACTN|nr:hypothetical protein [Streptomyces spongiae]MPY64312.1 hypothetical protein [Streptomyces spongiae]